MSNKVELLSPAGNKEAYYGAVHAGADAIYLGGEKYGARAYADNFTTEEIIECIRYGHLHGCRTYLTVNTLVKEEELRDFIEFLVPFYQNGLDGVIVQDLGACVLIHAIFPDMELHISTQMTITGSYGADYVKELGAVRVVPARECSLYDIENMKKSSGLEIESFIHGAMCYCYSGQCLFSSVLGQRSGNRGRCAGPCRLPYKTMVDGKQSKKEYYPLSLKDMCTLEQLPKLIHGGIDSFKIEGRMKKPEYTAGVTKIYRKYIDRYYQLLEDAEKGSADGKKAGEDISVEVAPKDMDFLRQLYIRSEIQEGYYFKHNGKDMITLKEAGYKGSEPSVLESIRKEFLEDVRRLPVRMMVEMIVGQKALIQLRYEDLNVTVYGDLVERANQKALTVEDIQKQFSKMGNTFFYINDLDVFTDQSGFYPVKSMNQLRRDAVKELENKIIEKNGFVHSRDRILMECFEELVCTETVGKQLTSGVRRDEKRDTFSVEIQSLDQGKALLDIENADFSKLERIYLADYLLMEKKEEESGLSGLEYREIRFLIQKARNCNVEIILSCPVITAERQWEVLNRVTELTRIKLIDGVLVKNYEQLRYLTLHEYRGKIYSDANMYLWNRASICQMLKDVNGFTYPYELSRKEERALFEKEELLGLGEKIVYGRIPLMTTANCLMKTCDSCKGKGVHYTELCDRMNVKFPVRVNCKDCLNTVYNSVPLSLHKEINRKYGNVLKRLIFTTESKEETENVIRFFMKLSFEKGTPNPNFAFTSGYEKDGVL